jgi:RsmE family RNA methyltransferase
VFEPAILEEHLLRGVEQGGVPRLPRVSLWKELRALCKEQFTAEPERSEQRWYADTRTSTPIRMALNGTEASGSERCWIAIGPESGWSEREHQKLLSSQFTPVSLGAPILRVDHALSVLTGVLLAASSPP